MKIFLVGMPGSGKSTLGKQLANEMHLPFIDLDAAIERHESKSISDIFASQGEDYFRLIESKLLREFASANDSFILATGGGAPCFYDGMKILNDSGITIFLNVPESKLIKRLQKSKDRPLLANEKSREEKILLLYKNRIPIYSSAQIILRDPDVKKVLQAIQERGSIGKS